MHALMLCCKIKYTILHLALYLLLCSTVSSQSVKESKWQFQGYVKSLQGLFNFNFNGNERQTLSDNFLHHRLNSEWYASDHFTLKSALRTRIFFGEFSRFIPDYGHSLSEGGNDILNLTLINSGTDVLLHSMIDRLYLEYAKENLEIRFGRQRINWGINTIWNPNDLFNAYSFTDFDYEERPGSDALRFRYYIGYAGSIEFAAKAFANSDEIVAAGLYKFNANDYDFQILAGWSFQDVVLGGGWAGNIKNVGFKGEFSWFNSTDENIANTFAIALSGDYSFKSGFFLVGGLLFNDAATNDANSNLFSFDLSARNLYPYSWSTFIQTAYPLNPLLNIAMAFIYSPVTGHPIFLSPTLTYSLANNLDADLVGQIVLQDGPDGYGSNANVFYLRVKWSY